jgi:hypothetical protein
MGWFEVSWASRLRHPVTLSPHLGPWEACFGAKVLVVTGQHLFLQLPSDIQGPGSNPGVGGVIRTNIARPCSKYCTPNEIKHIVNKQIRGNQELECRRAAVLN